MVGFTGVEWENRTALRLTTDLAAGPGAMPLAEAAAAWTGAGGDLAQIGVDLSATVRRLGTVWSVADGPEVSAALRRIVDWIAEISRSAHQSGDLADRQAAAVEVARRTMPHPDTMAGTELSRALAAIGPAGAVLLGIMADVEHAQQSGRLRAARVMAAYEQAATEAVRSWYAPTGPPTALATKQGLADPVVGDTERHTGDHDVTGPREPRTSVTGTGAGTPGIAMAGVSMVPGPAAPGRYTHTRVGATGGDGSGTGSRTACSATPDEPGASGNAPRSRAPAGTSPGTGAVPSAVPAAAPVPAQPAPGAQASPTGDRWARVEADAAPGDSDRRPTWADIAVMDVAAVDVAVMDVAAADHVSGTTTAQSAAPPEAGGGDR